MDVSIILVSYNTKELTKNCIKSIYEKTEGLNFDILVTDNASSDGSGQMIKEEFPDVKLIESPENLGFGKANNLAMKQSDAEYVFLLNTDTVLLNNAVKVFFDFMAKPENHNIGACGGQLYNSDMTLQCSTGEFNTIEKLSRKAWGINFIETYCRLKSIFNKEILKSVQTENTHYFETDYIIGADLMLRKSVIDEIGAFDEKFFMFCEEAELCFRIKKNGYGVMFVPGSKILHYGGASVYNANNQLAAEKMLLEGNILFFKICCGEKTAEKAKLLYIIYCLRYLPLRLFSPKAFQRLKTAIEIKI